MEDQEVLDKKKVAEQTAALSRIVFLRLAEALKESTQFEFASNDVIVSLLNAEREICGHANVDLYSEVPELYKKLAIYRAMWAITESMREVLIKDLGGKPEGEAHLHHFEKWIVQCLLPLIEISDFDDLTLRCADETFKPS